MFNLDTKYRGTHDAAKKREKKIELTIDGSK